MTFLLEHLMVGYGGINHETPSFPVAIENVIWKKGDISFDFLLFECLILMGKNGPEDFIG